MSKGLKKHFVYWFCVGRLFSHFVQHLTFDLHSVLAPETLLIYHHVKKKSQNIGFPRHSLTSGNVKRHNPHRDNLSICNKTAYVFTLLHRISITSKNLPWAYTSKNIKLRIHKVIYHSYLQNIGNYLYVQA